MEITITKSDFEAALPVGTSSHDNVFDSIRPAVELYESQLHQSLLGVAGEEQLGKDDGNLTAIAFYKRLVCLGAFLSVIRQLDLVLTPTGFGIVSNDNVSPASKQRVDALEGQLRTQYYKTLAMTLNLLRSENWGVTPQAHKYINHVYDEYTYFFDTHQSSSYIDWAAFKQNIEEAEEVLREKMGDRQMDDILDAFRRADVNRLEPYRSVIALIVRFTDTWASRGMDALRQPVFRRLMCILEDDKNKEYFKLYLESDAYKTNHHEIYRNTKESTAYIFNG